MYIDSRARDPAAKLLKLGGAKVILATASSGEVMSAVQGGLAVNGTLLILGAATSMQVSPLVLILGCRSIKAGIPGRRSIPRIRSRLAQAPACGP